MKEAKKAKTERSKAREKLAEGERKGGEGGGAAGQRRGIPFIPQPQCLFVCLLRGMSVRPP